jgi:hypothetical protein
MHTERTARIVTASYSCLSGTLCHHFDSLGSSPSSSWKYSSSSSSSPPPPPPLMTLLPIPPPPPPASRLGCFDRSVCFKLSLDFSMSAPPEPPPGPAIATQNNVKCECHSCGAVQSTVVQQRVLQGHHANECIYEHRETIGNHGQRTVWNPDMLAECRPRTNICIF